MNERESDKNPFLQGNFAPWRVEGDAVDLQVEGEIPASLCGTFYRNGSNPAYEPQTPYHWFSGDGMIHSITLRDGRASYRNRYVQSRSLLESRSAGRATRPSMLRPDPSRPPPNVANTNIISHAGRLLALVESSLPTELDAGTLATLGEYDFGGRLAGPMTAHPKLDPETGELLFFGNARNPPGLTYHVVDRSGTLVRSSPIQLAWPSMVHDFAITRDHVVFLLAPLVFRPELAAQGRSPFSWEPSKGLRIGVLSRRDEGAAVRWLETEGCFVFHPLNAYDEGSSIVLDVARYASMHFMSAEATRDPAWTGDNAARLHRFDIDLREGVVRGTALDDASIEFPRVDERVVGRKHRFGYAAAAGPEGTASRLPVWTAVRRYDLVKGTMETRSFGEGNGAGEPLFVPRSPHADEGDGYVLVLVYDRARNASDFHVLDAQNIAGEPVARIRLEHRVPYGFHGNWVAA
jgi:carotenoid cleavage dioxygenase